MQRKLIFLHGYEGSSQGDKAQWLRSQFPDILIPDFSGSLDERMTQLEEAIGADSGWSMVGSSFGGLMAAIYTCQHPARVEKLVLLAPALIWPDFTSKLPPPVDVRTVIYHGSRDQIIPAEASRRIAEQIFHNLDFNEVDDDHGLQQTVRSINWYTLLEIL